VNFALSNGFRADGLILVSKTSPSIKVLFTHHFTAFGLE
jgi:hypothetical protein